MQSQTNYIVMKKSFLLAALAGICLVMPALAKDKSDASQDQPNTIELTQGDKPEDKFAKIEFDQTRINLGTFSESKNPIQKCTFTFTNTGTVPLLIHQASASCGCTVPSYSKSAVKPGEKGKIDVSYNGTGKFAGHFQKTIVIRSNAKNEVVRLFIEGNMTE